MEYDLPIGEGITPLQILNCAARFEMIIHRLAGQEEIYFPNGGEGMPDYAENEAIDDPSSEKIRYFDIKEMP